MKNLSNSSRSHSSAQNTGHLLAELFRCPEDVADFSQTGELSPHLGYFRLGADTVCYGQCSSGDPAQSVMEPLHDAGEHVIAADSLVQLPFDPLQVVNSLRTERYFTNSIKGNGAMSARALRAIYYAVRPMMGVSVRKHLQRFYFRGHESASFPKWPVDVTVESIMEQLLIFAMKSRNLDRLPFIWFWPEGIGSCTILSHDVETSVGLDFCPQLMDLDDSFGIKASFQIIPEERYAVTEAMLQNIRDRGFEINVHDLNHDGRLFSDREQFLRRAKQINQYGKQYGALGFRSAVLYRNIDWFGALDFSYDMSLPNVAHLDPQRGGCCTIFPFFIGDLVELPVTTTQDYSLFNILKDYSIRLWNEQIARIREKHGLISIIIHPDYVIESSARQVYAELLGVLRDMGSRGETWIALPGEVAAWWRLRSEMKLVRSGGSWRIEGQGNERAKLAYAVLKNGRLTYELDGGTRGVSAGLTMASTNSQHRDRN